MQRKVKCKDHPIINTLQDHSTCTGISPVAADDGWSPLAPSMPLGPSRRSALFSFICRSSSAATIATLALGVSPWAHGRGMDRLTLIGTGYARACTARACTDRCMWSPHAGPLFVIRKQLPTEFWLRLLFCLFFFLPWPIAMALHSSGLCWLPSLCFAWCQWPSAFSRICNPHRSAARRRRTPRCLFVGLLKFTIDLQDTWSRLIA